MTNVMFNPETKATLPTSSITDFDPAGVMDTRWLAVVLTPEKVELVPDSTDGAAGLAAVTGTPGAVT